MNRIILPFALITGLLFFSCNNQKAIFDENQSFGEDLTWYQKDIKTFVIDIKENRHPYEFILNFRYASGYFFDKALLQMTETDPLGNKTRRDIDLVIRDSKGEFIGDKGYDIIDLEFVIDAKKEYKVFGKYTYEISQVMPDIDPLQFCMEIGLAVREAK